MEKRRSHSTVPTKTKSPEGDEELRCHCRRLLARVENGTLELLCPRCKRRALIDLSTLALEGKIDKSVHFE